MGKAGPFWTGCCMETWQTAQEQEGGQGPSETHPHQELGGRACWMSEATVTHLPALVSITCYTPSSATATERDGVRRVEDALWVLHIS